MKNLANMMKQAQQMKSKMKEMQDSLKELRIEGQSGGGMVRVTLSGQGIAQGFTIDESLIKADEKEILEDLVVAAFNDGKSKLDEAVQEKTKEAMGGLSLPDGMSLPF